MSIVKLELGKPIRSTAPIANTVSAGISINWNFNDELPALIANTFVIHVTLLTHSLFVLALIANQLLICPKISSIASVSLKEGKSTSKGCFGAIVSLPCFCKMSTLLTSFLDEKAVSGKRNTPIMRSEEHTAE